MPPDDLPKLTDFLALAREEDDLVQADAKQILDDLAPGIISLMAKVAPKRRAEAVVVIADTKHETGAMVARAILKRVPSGPSKMSEVGASTMYFVQPRATVDAMLDALGLPIPEHWSEPVEVGMIRIAMFLEVGLYATDWTVPEKTTVVGRA